MPPTAATTMPLAADYFSRKSLSSNRVMDFMESSRLHLAEAIDRLHEERDQAEIRIRTWSTASVTRLPFRNEVDEDGFSILEREGSRVRFKRITIGNRCDVSFACHGDIEGHPQEIMELMYADNTLDLRQWGKIYFPYLFMDGAILHSFQRKKDHSPITFAGVEWMAMRLPQRNGNNTDICYHKIMGMTTDHYGQDLHYILFESVDIPTCPLQERTLGLVRSSIYIAIFFQSTSKGTRMTCFGAIMPHISIQLSPRAVDGIATSVLNSITNLSLFVESYRISKRPLIDRMKWVPNSSRRACYLCQSSFNFFRTRHHCRSCGEIICKKCMVMRPLYENLAKLLAATGADALGEKFCKQCVLSARTTRKEQPNQPATLESIAQSRSALKWSADDAAHKETERRSMDIPARSKPINIKSPLDRTVLCSENSSFEARPVILTAYGNQTSNSLPSCTKYIDTPKGDAAKKLWQMSCKASATWALTKETSYKQLSRQSTPISTPKSGDPTSEVEMRDSFQRMNQSLAEQASLLEAIDRASRGRYSSPMGSNRSDPRERYNCWDDSRFEVIPDIAT